MRIVPRVLVVEDEHDIALLIKHALERSGDASVEMSGAAIPRSAPPRSSHRTWSSST